MFSDRLGDGTVPYDSRLGSECSVLELSWKGSSLDTLVAAPPYKGVPRHDSDGVYRRQLQGATQSSFSALHCMAVHRRVSEANGLTHSDILNNGLVRLTYKYCTYCMNIYGGRCSCTATRCGWSSAIHCDERIYKNLLAKISGGAYCIIKSFPSRHKQALAGIRHFGTLLHVCSICCSAWYTELVFGWVHQVKSSPRSREIASIVLEAYTFGKTIQSEY